MAKGEPYQPGPMSGVEIIGPEEYGNWSKKLLDASYPVRYGCGHTGRETHRKIQSMWKHTLPRKCPACAKLGARPMTARKEFMMARFHSEVPSLSVAEWPAPPSVIAARGGGDG